MPPSKNKRLHWSKLAIIGIACLITGSLAALALAKHQPNSRPQADSHSASTQPRSNSITPKNTETTSTKEESTQKKQNDSLGSTTRGDKSTQNSPQPKKDRGGGSTTPSPTPLPTPPSEDFPSASTAGPSGCSIYTDYSGTLNITTNGTVLSCIRLNGLLTVNADNVTVQNSILTGTTWWGIRVGNTKTDATNFRLLHSRLTTVPGGGPDNGGYDYGIAQEATGTMEIGYNDISGYKDGVTISGGSIHDNYIHTLSQFAGAHTQDIYVYPGSQVTINHNTLINDSPLSQATAAIYIAPDAGHQNDRVVTNNFLAGGAYTIYGGDNTATNIIISGNKFSTQLYPNSGYYGWVAYWQTGNSGVSWTGNTWADGPSVGQTLTP